MAFDRRRGLDDQDLYLFNEGTHRRLGEKLGAHLEGQNSARFAVWAPNATSVSVIGDFNGWSRDSTPLHPLASSGIWQGRADGVAPGQIYKYAITTKEGRVLEKADPFAFAVELPPATGSVLSDLSYEWSDGAWMAARSEHNSLEAAMSIYELHLGSFFSRADRKEPVLADPSFSTRLIEYVRVSGFSHVELMPVMAHPFSGSWGYQVTGFFAPAAQYGTPQQVMSLVDELHQAGIGVILDWVPSHFPGDEFALANFDGTALFEHVDPRLGRHPDWGSLIFNYGRHEVRSFLASSAEHWLARYHADGLRVDAVASMLYLDYSRQPGEWIPNRYGGRENLDAVEFLQQLNIGIYADHPDVQVFAEESTAWPGVTRPVYLGGLGFGLKWDMGWMHDTLNYLSLDPVYRRFHHNEITFRALYGGSEHYVLPLSHDEVVHGKGSLLQKMPGDSWQKFAQLRLLLGYQCATPGKKLLFMGGEFGEIEEWNHDGALHWELLEDERHAGVRRWVADLNATYREYLPLSFGDETTEGFSFVGPGDAESSVVSFERRAPNGEHLLVACNFTPIVRHNYRVGVPTQGWWKELLNSDASVYGGSGVGNLGASEAQPLPWYGYPWTLTITLPPLGIVFFASPEAA